jgi:hypothetical protein
MINIHIKCTVSWFNSCTLQITEKVFGKKKVEYTKMDREKSIRCIGLPDGVRFADPAQYGPNDCIRILAAKDNVTFEGIKILIFF